MLNVSKFIMDVDSEFQSRYNHMLTWVNHYHSHTHDPALLSPIQAEELKFNLKSSTQPQITRSSSPAKEFHHLGNLFQNPTQGHQIMIAMQGHQLVQPKVTSPSVQPTIIRLEIVPRTITSTVQPKTINLKFSGTNN